MTVKIVQTETATHFTLSGVEQAPVLVHVDTAAPVKEGEVTIAGDITAFGQTVQVRPVEQAPGPASVAVPSGPR